MSCIRFSTTAQREQYRAAAPGMPAISDDDAASRMRVPEFTESKLRRLRTLAEHVNPKIRESVASSAHAPIDVLGLLARDSDPGVRSWVARNAATPPELVEQLSRDDVATVRGWAVTNPRLSRARVARLADDESMDVRGMVEWRLNVPV